RSPRVPFLVGGHSGEGGLWARDRWIASQFAQAGTPAFHSHFSHVRAGVDQSKGGTHPAELPLAWSTLGSSCNAENDGVAHAMHACWVAFARYRGTGDLDCGNNVSWPRFSGDAQPVLEFTSTGTTLHKTFRTMDQWLNALRRED